MPEVFPKPFCIFSPRNHALHIVCFVLVCRSKWLPKLRREKRLLPNKFPLVQALILKPKVPIRRVVLCIFTFFQRNHGSLAVEPLRIPDYHPKVYYQETCEWIEHPGIFIIWIGLLNDLLCCLKLPESTWVVQPYLTTYRGSFWISRNSGKRPRFSKKTLESWGAWYVTGTKCCGDSGSQLGWLSASTDSCSCQLLPLYLRKCEANVFHFTFSVIKPDCIALVTAICCCVYSLKFFYRL